MSAINYYEERREKYFIREIEKYYKINPDSDNYEMTIKSIVENISDEDRDNFYAKNNSMLFTVFKKKLEKGFGRKITNKTAIDILNRKFEYKILKNDKPLNLL